MTTMAVSKTRAAQLLGISRSSLYYRSKQFIKDWQLKIRMEEALRHFPSYGHKRLGPYLKIGKNRARRVMKKFGLKPYRRRGRKFKKRKDNGQVYPNLLMAVIPNGPQQVWVSDFTHLVYGKTILYLATVMDIWTREVVGFSLSTSHSVWLIIEAFLSALNFRGPPEMIHSDQGSEYKSRVYTGLVEEVGVKISMSHKASPWENGYQESFYSQFKVDLGDPNRFEEMGKLVAEIYHTIYSYNHTRIHTALKMSPKEYAILKTLASNLRYPGSEKVS